MLRRSMAVAIFVVLVAGLSAQTTPIHRTALYTLDAKQQTFVLDEGGARLDSQFTDWARACQVVPGGAIYVLDCPDPPPRAVRAAEGGSENDITVAVALFRDLDETVYLAGCPPLDKLPSRKGKPPARKEERAIESGDAEEDRIVADEQAEQDKEDRADCLEVAIGQTFTAISQGRALKIVMRGRQLPFTIFSVQPKKRRLGESYVPKPSFKKSSIVPVSPADYAARIGLTPGQVESEPPDPRHIHKPSYKKPSVVSVPPADYAARVAVKPDSISRSVASPHVRGGTSFDNKSLPTGRFLLECASRRASVFIDGEFVGFCPQDVPLIIGRHKVTVKQEGKPDWSREFHIESGRTVRMKADSGPAPSP